jgi:hypothetical protein
MFKKASPVPTKWFDVGVVLEGWEWPAGCGQ